MSVLDRERTVAGPGFNRWVIPPAALAIHLSIGEVYAFSVFKTSLVAHFDVSGTAIAWIFSIAIVMLGLSAAFGGTWMERNGPRKAMVLSAACFSTGLIVGSIGIATGRLWLLYLGYGVIGGIGLGIGYISPVSTLIKWFPDRPGLATGLAIMGFGGGALVASPLSNALLSRYDGGYDPTAKGATADGHALAFTFLTLGLAYLVLMLFGAAIIRVPDDKGAGGADDGHGGSKAREGWGGAQVAASTAIRTPQFALLWIVLFCNVTAGIGILEQASPMIQDFFRDGRRLGGDGRGRRRVRRAAVDREHGRPLRLVDHVGRRGPQAHLHAVPGPRRGAVPAAAARGRLLHGRVRGAHRRHPRLLRRRLRHGAGLPEGPVRDPRGRRHPRPAADRVVGRRRRRAAHRERHHRPLGHAGHAHVKRLPPGADRDGRAAVRRLRGQPADQARRPPALRRRRPARAGERPAARTKGVRA
ncbi:hypothetical protein GCM10025868_45790 [Angustibacter aerolatus]|uniref:Major facilitator superfamily (MFS) profile domain-containing protein n=1 Tax=Angustibacter aerolatus TaxID=1162965 RepID=A0ABQ6JCZ0_9ACTN|nr:MFS transporter [Angustibacter aerolatus]GMA84752.1 hypothetical protein GCM10025868_00020 [Angustibacter aerolatus]GMA89329.1 hypothetical protein GCM10025868_45790 [Angustibacter aerolatus]